MKDLKSSISLTSYYQIIKKKKKKITQFMMLYKHNIWQESF